MILTAFFFLLRFPPLDHVVPGYDNDDAVSDDDEGDDDDANDALRAMHTRAE